MNNYKIRAGTDADLRYLSALERDAVQAYRLIGYDFCADGAVREEAEHRQALRNGTVLVVEAPGGEIVGFALLWPVDGDAHLVELAVSQRHQGKGIGRHLIQRAEDWARATDFTQMTLTAFRDVPWNAPFYERLGFCVFEPDRHHKDLHTILADDRNHGFAVKPRVAMRKVIAGN